MARFEVFSESKIPIRRIYDTAYIISQSRFEAFFFARFGLRSGGVLSFEGCCCCIILLRLSAFLSSLSAITFSVSIATASAASTWLGFGFVGWV